MKTRSVKEELALAQLNEVRNIKRLPVGLAMFQEPPDLINFSRSFSMIAFQKCSG